MPEPNFFEPVRFPSSLSRYPDPHVQPLACARVDTTATSRLPFAQPGYRGTRLCFAAGYSCFRTGLSPRSRGQFEWGPYRRVNGNFLALERSVNHRGASLRADRRGLKPFHLFERSAEFPVVSPQNMFGYEKEANDNVTHRYGGLEFIGAYRSERIAGLMPCIAVAGNFRALNFACARDGFAAWRRLPADALTFSSSVGVTLSCYRHIECKRGARLHSSAGNKAPGSVKSKRSVVQPSLQHQLSILLTSSK